MSSATPVRQGGSLCYAGAIIIMVLLSCTQAAFGAAIIGQTKVVSDIPYHAVAVDQLKADYRRPLDIPFPKQNTYTLKKALLGQQLFFDRRLSKSSAQSCASCHDPGFAWGDGLPVGVGYGMQKLTRRSPSIINSAWRAAYLWDGGAASLEEQTKGPIQSPTEMNMPIGELLERLGSVSEYGLLFDAAFPNKGLSSDTLAEALATYERTIVSQEAPFDVWIDGDENAISESAKRGFALFNTKGHCSSCHEGWNFTNDGFHDIGLPGADPGRGRFLPRVTKMNHAFKTPGLREIARRGPYMHDGSLATLEEVIEHYDRGGIERASLSDLIVPLRLSEDEKLDLIAFLKCLSSELMLTTVPTFPR
ncbi:cytochrome-c peroxidase [Bradyrhizobium sp.]|jgi:cytochrome c peroxidase|uniref:cytochrome-c peroxidase n=1 Tax=Bradyrhizobium sp. TaxID=376 RepID=UPI003C145DF7